MTTNDPMLASQKPQPPANEVQAISGQGGPPEEHDPYSVLRNPDYRRILIGNAFSVMGMQMAGAAIGWELYGLTKSKVMLGLVGLVQVVPIVLLALPAGHIVDRFNRKKLILLMSAILTGLFVVMGLSSRFGNQLPGQGILQSINHGLQWFCGERDARFVDAHVPIMLILLLLIGTLRAVNQPAKQSIMPMLVPPAQFANAVTWSSSLFETCNMVGPTLAGVAIALFQGPDFHHTWAFAGIYWFCALCLVVQFINFAMIELRHPPRPKEKMTLKSMLAGIRFVTANKIILGTITLDLFAVLLGGASALLPVFASDVLHVGAVGYGMLRAAPSVGAISMALFLAHRPPMRHAGRNLMWAVTGFGAATIVFGLSGNFVLSLAALVFTGVFDNISVVVRHTLVQLLTPDAMRGRVNAVNSVFISCSNELGAFESGVTAKWWGPTTAVAVGGVGTILVVWIVALVWPQVRAVKELNHEPIEEPAAAAAAP